MALNELFPIGLVAAMAFSLLAGAAVMSWGRILPRQGDWLVAIGVLAVTASAAAGLFALSEGTIVAENLFRGWIGHASEAGAVTVGLLHDQIGLTITLMSAVVAGVILSNRALLEKEPRPERIHAACAIGLVGVTLSWLSLTAWLAFVGLTLAALGGFLALGGRWDQNDEARVATRFARDRVLGLFAAISGACALASSGNGLSWQTADAWGTGTASIVGGVLLVVGLVFQMQPFPLLGWVVMDSESLPFTRVLLGQVFTGWAALAVLIRVEGPLRPSGIFPAFGWIAGASAVLAVCAGLLQKDWRKSLGLWVSAAFSASVAAISFVGSAAGLALSFRSGLAATALALAGATLHTRESTSKQAATRTQWVKAGCILAAVAASAMLAFVAGLSNDLSLAPIFGLVVFLLVLLSWKITWAIVKPAQSSKTSFVSLASPYLLVLFCALSSWVTHPAWPIDWGPIEATFWPYWAAIVAGFAVAYWTSARKKDSWSLLARAFPRVSAFFAEGYWVDDAMAHGLKGLVWIGKSSEWLMDDGVWGRWIPNFVKRALGAIGGGVAKADEKVSEGLEEALRIGTEVPAKAMQLVQSGDMQWYVLFGVGSGLALLVHFLKT